MLSRLEPTLASGRDRIHDKLRYAPVVWPDVTTAGIDGKLTWNWVSVAIELLMCTIAARWPRSLPEDVIGGHKPDVWISVRCLGQRHLTSAQQFCLPRNLRDVRNAIEYGVRYLRRSWTSLCPRRLQAVDRAIS